MSRGVVSWVTRLLLLRGRRGFFPGAARRLWRLAEVVVERPVVGAVEALPCGDVAWHAVCPYDRDTAADSILIISTGGGLTWGTGPCCGRRRGRRAGEPGLGLAVL